MYMDTHVYTCTCMSVCIYLYGCACGQARICMNTCVYVHLCGVYGHVYTHEHVWMCLCMCMGMYVHRCMCMCAHMYEYGHICACMFEWAHVCMCVWTCMTVHGYGMTSAVWPHGRAAYKWPLRGAAGPQAVARPFPGPGLPATQSAP